MHIPFLHFSPFLLGCILCFLFSHLEKSSYALTSLITGGTLSLLVFVALPIRSLSPPPDGEYDVGIAEINLTMDRGASLPLSIFYPIEKCDEIKRKKNNKTPCRLFRKGKTNKMPWIPFGDHRFVRGLAKHASLPFFCLSHLLLLQVNVPAGEKCPPLVFSDGFHRPVILFSHGIAGFSRLYTSLLQQMASRGAIIFAVTHTDESAAFCRDVTNEWSISLDCSVPFTKESRMDQLLKRSNQVAFVSNKIRSGELFPCLGYSDEEVEKFSSRSPLIHLMGHSFGGSTILSMVGSKVLSSSVKSMADLGVDKIICLDPWFDPVEDLFNTLFSNEKIDKFTQFSYPTLILLSEEWKRLISDSLIFELTNCKKLFDIDVEVFLGTDHAYFCDVRVFSRLGKKKYCHVDPEKQIYDWGKKIMSFVIS